VGRYTSERYSRRFGAASPGERHSADLFFADLVGVGGAPVPVEEAPGAENWIPEPTFPSRPTGAPGGAAFMQTIWGEGAPRTRADWIRRDDAMVAALVVGNMPAWLRQWITIEVRDSSPNVKVRVLPDYLCVGSDADYRHVPLDQQSAQRVADAFTACLPTAKICHAIWRKTPPTHRIGAIPRDYNVTPWTRRRLIRQPWAQTSTAAYDEHSREIQKKFGTTIRPGQLVSGHKKDVVLSQRLHAQPAKIAFHGFYDSNGYPFQPCYGGAAGPVPTCNRETPTLAHPEGKGRFSDYSQGVRLVHPVMTIDGRMALYNDVLRNKELCRLISTEAAVNPPRIPKPPDEASRESFGESTPKRCRCGCRGSGS
jgi:hypothetical protein